MSWSAAVFSTLLSLPPPPTSTVTDTPRTVDNANITLHYSLMPYVGILTSGIAAEAQGSVDITYKKR